MSHFVLFWKMAKSPVGIKLPQDLSFILLRRREEKGPLRKKKEAVVDAAPPLLHLL